MNNRLKLKNLYKFNVYHIALFVILFISFFITALSVFKINTSILALMHLIPIGILINKLKIRLNLINTLWIIFAMFIIVWNKDFSHGNYIGFFSMIMTIYIMLIFQNDIKWADTAKKMLTFFVMLHACLGWLFLILKPLYISLVIPRFPASKQGVLRSFASSNVLIGLTNHYSTSGIYCSIGLIVAFCFFIQKPKLKKYMAFLFFMMISLVFTQKRGPLAFAVCSCIVIYFVYKKINIKTIMKFIAIVAVLGIVVIYAYINIESVNNALSRFLEFSDENADVSNGRMPLYGLAIDIFKENPLLGIGWGGYRYEYTKYRFLGGTAETMNAHNIYLQVLSEIGILGFVMLYSLMIYTFIKSIEILRKKDTYHLSESEQWMMMLSVGIQTLFFLSGIVENVIYYQQILYPYALVCAYTYYEMIKLKKSPFYKRKFIIKY
ncbi:MAG: O-antigen ligase family protein [Ruminococcus sp.]|nr:O-antigen ligase family protein [Ruminococcus sp.]